MRSFQLWQQHFSVTGNAVIQLGALEFNTHSLGRVRATAPCHMVEWEGTNICPGFCIPHMQRARHAWVAAENSVQGAAWPCMDTEWSHLSLQTGSYRPVPFLSASGRVSENTPYVPPLKKGRRMFNKVLQEGLNPLHVPLPCPLLPFSHQAGIVVCDSILCSRSCIVLVHPGQLVNWCVK